ncbi:MAG: OmpA family protein [Pyrinomonadaceae bacterium]|nr:OmpA family protein [Pyrinomonadaceae bacterium]
MSDAKGILDEDASSVTSDEGTMAELRSLLLGPAEAQLAEVHERLLDPQRQTEEVSRVLPDAIAVRSRQDNDLTTALAPTVSAALEYSVRKNPQPLADAIFPIMGPAIRKAIAAALSGMAQSFNQTLTHSMSARGLAWRWEALKTGRPFSEVVLLHTLLFRVEQVFLIHQETGLLLRHVSAANAAVQDADMVSGMLTAIQDFVRDSFTTRQGEQLETLQVGELTVWIEQGPQAILAGVIRGNAPQQLREVFQETLERIHLQYGTALKEFSGDAAPFSGTEPLLQDCLQSGYDVDQHKVNAGRKLSPLRVIAGIVLIALAVWGFFWLRDRWRWDAYVQRLRAEPGIVVTDSGRQGGKHFVSGLRDPLSRDPAAMIQDTGLDANSVVERWQPFQALTPDFVLARAKKSLEPPTTVKLRLNDGLLEAEGFASHQWVLETRRVARLLPGVSQFREDKLLDLERIENPLLMFDLDQTEIRSDQQEKLNQLVAEIKHLRELAGEKKVRLEITGRTDGSGTETKNSALSRGRAEAVAAALKANLLDWTNLTIIAVGSKEKLREEVTEIDRATNRSVTLKVIVTESN